MVIFNTEYIKNSFNNKDKHSIKLWVKGINRNFFQKIDKFFKKIKLSCDYKINHFPSLYQTAKTRENLCSFCCFETLDLLWQYTSISMYTKLCLFFAIITIKIIQLPRWL